MNHPWTEKYRPKTVAECILPQHLKETFQSFVDKNDVPNLLLVGSSGTGKTSVSMAMLEQLGVDSYFVPSSLKRGIDTLRTEIMDFASSVSFKGNRKFVILDEADNLTPDTQLGLRNFMEQYASNCGFILTANHKNKVLEAVQSRCAVIKFDIAKAEMPKLAMQLLKRTISILETEHVKEYDKAAIAGLISKYYPDSRRVLNELQRYSVAGKIDIGILTAFSTDSVSTLVGFMKSKDYTKVRHWAGENATQDFSSLYREFYDKAYDYFKPSYVPELVIQMAEYMKKHATSLDPEINWVAFCTEVMVSAEWK